MKAETYHPRKDFIANLTEEQKTMIKFLYLEKGLSMSSVSRKTNITIGVVQKFIKLEGISRNRIEAVRNYHQTKDVKTKLVASSDLDIKDLTAEHYIEG